VSTEDRFGELQTQAHFGVGAGRRAPTATATALHLPEEGLEDVADAALESEPAGAGAPNTPSGPKRS
jgi:hypothetical protein